METSTRFTYSIYIIYYYGSTPNTVAARSEAWTVFARLKAGIVGSNPNQGMDVCLRLFCVCVSSGLETGWFPVQGVLPTVLGLRNWSETKRFTDALCSKVGATGEREREKKLVLQTLAAFSVSWAYTRLLPTHRTTQIQNKRTQYIHPCLEWDSNPQFQRSRDRRQFMPSTTLPLWRPINYDKTTNYNKSLFECTSTPRFFLLPLN
jgi:hypothetical protein